MSSTPTQINRLADATSPYLRQHADNPVHWQPWDETALAAARDEGKLILLSIGYSACHWCHVMAHESFEDAQIAAQMNRDFINIKVDREERPDLDRIYQTAHQLLTGRGGGWPLTVFLTPDQLPFFAGTYFPRQGRQGMPGFDAVMERVVEVYRDRPEEIHEQNADMQQVLERLAAVSGEAELPGREALEDARLQLGERFDPAFGGFGSAPKFPQPVALNRLLRHYARSERSVDADRGALHMACHTLRRMALGGLYDQVGGGFARYSVDGEWMIPHFEKMLSDNALLMSVATDAHRATGDRFFRRIARETGEWALREMRLPEGGFATSLDADTSEGEGVFYLWTPDEVRDVLDADEAELVILRLGLDEKPNFEGRWHPQVHMAFSELAKRLQTPRDGLVQRWQSAQAKLRKARDERERPGRDDKALTAWNALMIRGLARAGRLLGLPEFIDAAEAAEQFVHQHLWRDGRLLASWRAGQADLPGYLDDHAFMLDALIELQQARWDSQRMAWATRLGDVLLEQFEDPRVGGFFFTAADHESLIQRPRTFTDDALPSGNGIAALALNRLACLVGEPRYSKAAERAVRAGAEQLEQTAAAQCALLDALDELIEPPEVVVVRADDNALEHWMEVANAAYQPNRLVFTPPVNAPLASTPAGETGAWVCRGHTCLPKAATPTELADRLTDTP
ncbi:thioredoxin domain-containing protein [Spiribacter pallidus]|uniref:Thioredoxin domain-containing protein n=1 Tax=Spiribacter pallidus TaxID=1987936 RepID=A0ABV3TDE5_9GAMM